MNTGPITCPKCATALFDGVFNQPGLTPCPACGDPLQIEVFPALFRRITPGRGGEALLVENEASCFYHPHKKAILPCAACGRFLCALCDCEFNGQHLCPACLETGRQKGKIKSLENHRTLHDSIALALAIYPMLIFYFTITTAPMALFVAIRYWNAPRSIVHRTRIRYVAAIVIALLQLAGWSAVVYFITTSRRPHG